MFLKSLPAISPHIRFKAMSATSARPALGTASKRDAKRRDEATATNGQHSGWHNGRTTLGGGSMATVAPTTRDVASERAAIDAHIAGKTLLDAFAQTVEVLGETDAIKWKVEGPGRR